ncbi:alpha/beta fold hydrolase [Modestobacter italicus]|uniref:alpha/beta fold hydrolase n=1 Tax=Modestobacter italicus (strain DSM 44449 / CECT 9708 / BC 501) TaxID=2732864 RepID=UPI001C97C62E|nr:alpha/beta hydrolase [Modestobacter italicus]
MPTEHLVTVAPGVQLWVEERGAPEAPAVLLVMGAASSGLVWPEPLVDRLARDHRVIRYDHRDTGRSTAAFEDAPYAIRDLATDAVAVLDALDVERAHVVGMSMGGLLVQLLLLDHPHRLRSATLFCTGALAGAGGEPPPGPSDGLLAWWATMAEPRDEAAELAWRVEHWRLLNGSGMPFDPVEWRETEERVRAHSGGSRTAVAHASADQAGLDRGAELAGVAVPTLVVEAPADPAYPPPNAQHLAAAVGTGCGGVPARLVTVPGMGHALAASVLGPFGDAVTEHLTAVDAGG